MKLLLVREDKRSNSWLTAHEELTADFAALGCSPPRVVFWNVRANTAGFQAGATTPGVAMVSGYSPTLMKQFLVGEWAIAPDVKATPQALLYQTLDNPVFGCVRKCVRETVLELSNTRAQRQSVRCVVS